MKILYFAAAILIVISIHEAAHALIAYKLGDPTAKQRGRLTLNPLAHLDVIGTLMIFIVGIGWGKPVPVNPRNFSDPVRASALTSLAGPVSNFLTAMLLAIPLKYFVNDMPEPLYILVLTVFDLSILLGLFNMLPFPPLDGSKILGLFVPRRYEREYMNFLETGLQYFVIFLVIDFFVLGRFFDFSILGFTIGSAFSFLKSLILFGV
jgi:Zn-dependent protease